MPTKNVVPNADNEGSLGTAVKKWQNGHFTNLNASSLLVGGSVIDEGVLASALQPADVVNNLLSTDVDAPLSAAQGKALKDLIVAINADGLAFGGVVSQIDLNGVIVFEGVFAFSSVINLSSLSAVKPIFSNGIAQSSILRIDTDGSVKLSSESQGITEIAAAGSVSTGAHSLQISRAADNTTMVVVDGGLAGNGAVVGGDLNIQRLARQATGGARLGGILSDVVFCNRALTASEALAIAKDGIDAWRAANPENMWGGQDVANGTFTNVSQSFNQFGTVTGASTLGFTAQYDNSNVSNRIGAELIGGVRPKGYLIIKFNAALAGSDTVGLTLSRSSSMGQGDGQLVGYAAEGANRFVFDVSPVDVLDFVGFIVTSPPASGNLVISDFSVETAGIEALYRFDEGANAQVRDASSNRLDGVVSGDFEHIKPQLAGTLRAYGVDGTTTGYPVAFGSGDILSADTVITGIVIDRQPRALVDVEQNVSLRRIRKLANGGGSVSIQRGDGSTWQTLCTVSPADDADFDINSITTQRI